MTLTLPLCGVEGEGGQGQAQDAGPFIPAPATYHIRVGGGYGGGGGANGSVFWTVVGEVDCLGDAGGASSLIKQVP